MALRWCVLLAIVGYALAQSGDDDLLMRYDTQQAMAIRGLHFYCQAAEMNEEDFLRVDRDVTWSMLIQYPVLAYLDSARKGVLVRQILNVTNRQDASLLLVPEDICIGNVVQYQVTYYRESVLIYFYFQNTARSAADVVSINTAFKDGHEAAAANNFGDENDARVVPFLNTFAIVVDPEEALNQIEMNTHPGNPNEFENDSENPTLRAVVINSVAGSVFMDREAIPTEDLINELISGEFVQVENVLLSNGQPSILPNGETEIITRIVSQPPLNRFADNPNPINYFLEAGDIVFIVFGVVFLFLLVLLILTGFCIHPFFLA